MTSDYDVLAVGNAIVDVIATTHDGFFDTAGFAKGSMRLIDAAQARDLYAQMGPGREISGGSAANTAAGVAALGARAAFVGRVSSDQLGTVFAHDIRAAGVDYRVPVSAGGRPTGQCLIQVTPDAQRTMSTYLGSCQELDESDIDEAAVRAAKCVYLEGYLWDPPAPTRALKKAISIARAAGNTVAFTLSDVFCVNGFRSDFLGLLGTSVDLLFGNANEICALFETDDIATAMNALAGRVPLAVVTMGADGAVVVQGSSRHTVPITPARRVLDTTGAGDLFAAGFLAGHTQGRSLVDSAVMGTIAAAEVIDHFGARPEADLQALVAARLG
jgi:sugar/nucleoside kinase (ribokinase family)